VTTLEASFKMNADVKKMWLDALRSGEYAQGRSTLRSPSGYCCLGVLCDLAVKNGVIPEPQEHKNKNRESGISHYGYGQHEDESGHVMSHSAYLPEAVAVWAGTSRFGDRYAPNGEPWPLSLAGLNDQGATFAEIADIIEAEF
jgi:hypothetical protein